ncbi:hypothetical protein ANRL1_03502 [Anaerolineae bacterium]|nr:hypothetical protein ANRL1_03502 [Anaerolineae bacterium]
MGKIIPEKQILVISDDESVARVTELAIKREEWVVPFVFCLSNQPASQLPSDKYNLIILVLRSYDLDPVVALAKASLTSYVGQIPILIISDKPFLSDASTQIYHMDFPFTTSQLNVQVRRILQEEAPNSLVGSHDVKATER